jgi:hypothetical protein
MNRLERVSLAGALCLCIAAGAWAQSNSGKPTLDLAGWYAANDNWKTVNNGSWSSDPKDAPSDKALTTMLDVACKAQTAINWNEFFFIVVRDPAEQEAIINGTQWKGSTSAGTVTIIILADQVADQANHKDKYDPSKLYMQSPMAYFDTGMACGLLNIAAYSLGYSTHYFASASGKSITPTDKTTYGFGQYPTPNWNISRFVKGRNYVRGWGFPNPEAKFAVEGNCVMIAAVVIGKANPAVDATTAATQHGRPKNYAFWAPDHNTPPLN